MLSTVHAILSAYDHRLIRIIEYRYGLNGREPETFTAISERLGITRQRAQQLHDRAMLIIRQAYKLE